MKGAFLWFAAALGCMFRSYQKAAGIEHSAFDGKGFHSLRRRLERELVIDGVPLSTISQVLGHRDVETAKRYISLDSVHLQECALDFSLIGGADMIECNSLLGSYIQGFLS